MNSVLTGRILAVAGLAGLIASFVLTLEKLATLSDPAYVPSCSINPIISCGTIMSSPQAEVFGFPNPISGLIGFTALTTVGVLAATGVSLPRWCWFATLAGLALAATFVHWLIFASLYSIQALCPYCMIVWISVVCSLWYCALHLAVSRTNSATAATAARYHSVVPTVWMLLVVLAITEAFWWYWRTLA
ncbi:vitamin K epoxide reductase family protein [Rhodococcus sp. NPDC056516]|uniref:vitamin K epoxide reductase family protein n=1 Tax=unclassified Rhodococcus (in: high G+C Gram-positive bacteria) TaxID=192944 RepID=UPI0036704925